MGKTLPKELTSYDLLKSFAVIIMIMDHVGFYFFPNVLEWRALGRIGFPIWFFLVGYARGRDIPKKLLTGIVILAISDLITGLYVFPFSAIATIALIRISLDKVMFFCNRSLTYLWTLSAILFVLVIPSYVFLEYGIQALILSIFGYLVRHKKERGYDKNLLQKYMIFSLFSFVFWQQFIFIFPIPLFIAMSSGTLIVLFVLLHFDLKLYPTLTAKLPEGVNVLLRFMGRRTLEIYVVHLVLFKFIDLLADDDRFSLFGWEWFYMF